MHSDLESLAARLRAYNEWRRGAEIEMPNPVDIGRDIDAAIDVIEQLACSNERNHGEMI